MRIATRDLVASAFVMIAAVSFAVWATVTQAPSDAAVRVMAATVLALGVAASAMAVVPAFDALLHGSKAYLAAASLLGLTALVAGLRALMIADGSMLNILVLATVTLWVMATMRHTVAASREADQLPTGAGHARHGHS